MQSRSFWVATELDGCRRYMNPSLFRSAQTLCIEDASPSTLSRLHSLVRPAMDTFQLCDRPSRCHTRTVGRDAPSNTSDAIRGSERGTASCPEQSRWHVRSRIALAVAPQLPHPDRCSCSRQYSRKGCTSLLLGIPLEQRKAQQVVRIS